MLSQKEFAERVGVSFATVNRWENGKSNPNYQAVRKIEQVCKLYEIDVDCLQLIRGIEDESN